VTNTHVRRRGAYAPLAATYYTDDDVMEAGEDAELLFVRSLAFCAGNPASDGYVTDKQVARVFGTGMTELPDRIQALVSVGLWERVPGGYAVRSWLKWNKSAEEMGRFKARDRDRKSAKGPADEALVEPSEVVQAASDFQTDSDSFPHGIRMEPGTDSDPISVTHPERNDVPSGTVSVALTQHNTTQHSSQNKPPSSPATPATGEEDPADNDAGEEGDAGEDIPNPRGASYWDRVDLNNDPDFKDFWTAYPRRVAKGAARKAWRSIMKKGGVEASAVIAGAAAYRDDPDRKPDITFTAHPASWLNAERWTDYDEPDLVAVANSAEWWNN
jgi:hypothetical protein